MHIVACNVLFLGQIWLAFDVKPAFMFHGVLYHSTRFLRLAQLCGQVESQLAYFVSV